MNARHKRIEHQLNHLIEVGAVVQWTRQSNMPGHYYGITYLRYDSRRSSSYIFLDTAGTEAFLVGASTRMP